MSGGAYADRRVRLGALGSGPLEGMSFAAKDVFEVAGRVAAAGSPAFAATRRPAVATAPAILRLLEAGARLEGMTVTEELMFGVLGQGPGAPANPRAPGRLAGGSSTGSAVAVATGACDFALGTDTGGSVRVPASFCGLYGLRPSQGAVPAEGVVPLAPRFDTVGWFARTPEVLEAVGRVLLPPSVGDFAAVWLPPEATAGLAPGLAAALEARAAGIAAALGLSLEREALGSGPGEWLAAWKVLQGLDCWLVYGGWIETARPALGPLAARRFAAAGRLSMAEAEPAEALRAALAEALAPLRAARLLVMPTTPGPAPLRRADAAGLEAARAAILGRTALAGLLGLPELSAPWLVQEGLPVGLSLIAAPGADLRLCALAGRLAAALHIPEAAAPGPTPANPPPAELTQTDLSQTGRARTDPPSTDPDTAATDRPRPAQTPSRSSP